MEKLNYTIERADNGYIIEDTDTCGLNVYEDRVTNIELQLGKELMGCIKHIMDAECNNKAKIKIEIDTEE